MGLVGKTRLQGDVGQGVAPGDLPPGGIQAAQPRVAIGAGAHRRPELASQVVPRQPGDLLQLPGADNPVRRGVQEGPGPLDRAEVEAAR